MKLEIPSINIWHNLSHTDQIVLKVATHVDPCDPEGSVLELIFHAPKDTAEEYCRVNFPGVPVNVHVVRKASSWQARPFSDRRDPAADDNPGGLLHRSQGEDRK